jgi:hypothetical protein
VHPVLRQCAVGLAAGIAGGFTMNLFSRVVVGALGREADGAAPGADRVGRGAQPPQALGNADHDAAVLAGSAVYRTVTRHDPSAVTEPRLGTAAHYAFSGAAGVGYVLLSERVPALRAGYGIAYGSLVWALADEGVTPALGLSRGPRQLPAGVHVYALLAHWVFGATLEAARRAMRPGPSLTCRM